MKEIALIGLRPVRDRQFEQGDQIVIALFQFLDRKIAAEKTALGAEHIEHSVVLPGDELELARRSPIDGVHARTLYKKVWQIHKMAETSLPFTKSVVVISG